MPGVDRMVALLIAFEGIDGAGKTTTASLLAASLASSGYSASEANKREPRVTSPFAKEQLRALADRLWGIPHDDRLESLGDLHWIYLNAAYFAGIHYSMSAELGPRGVIILDSWINKFVARVTTNGRFKIDEVLAILDPLPQPDMVFLLDVPPATADRRKSFVTDLERGSLGGGHRDFETYQAIIRKALLLMADRFGWTVISPGDRSAAQVAAEVAHVVRARLDSRRWAASGKGHGN
jgi:thymidylate kinase